MALETGRIIPGSSRLPEDIEGRFVALCAAVQDESNARRLVLGGREAGWDFCALAGGFVDLLAPVVPGSWSATHYNLRNEILHREIRKLADAAEIQQMAVKGTPEAKTPGALGWNRLDSSWRDKALPSWESDRRAWDRRSRFDKGALING